MEDSDERCFKCWQNYDMSNMRGDYHCITYHELLNFRLVGRDGVCGKLEVILRNVEKVRNGGNNVSYPRVVKMIQEVMEAE